MAWFRQLCLPAYNAGMNASVRRAALAVAATGFVALTTALLPADVCVYKPPKVRRICGIIVDQQGVAIPGVTVSILKDATTIGTSATADTGEFDFDAMEPGTYELDTTAPGFQHARYQLSLSKPTRSCKNALLVRMEVGGVHCEGDARNEQTSEPKVTTGDKSKLHSLNLVAR